MIKNITSIKIGTIWNDPSGATIKDSIDSKPDLGEDIKLNESIQADLTLVRLKDGLTAILENLSTDCQLECCKCLDSFKFPISVATTERQFYENKPERDYDPFEVFLIDRQAISIDLTEMIRQEIILHFPMIPVCSKRCRGLCPGCHINLNHTQKHHSGCTEPQLEESNPTAEHQHKPFANLKDLIATPHKKK